MKTDSQNTQIKNHLESGRSLTSLQALAQFNCWRLSARIYHLRKRYGLDIKSVDKELPNGKIVSRYFI